MRSLRFEQVCEGESRLLAQPPPGQVFRGAQFPKLWHGVVQAVGACRRRYLPVAARTLRAPPRRHLDSDYGILLDVLSLPHPPHHVQDGPNSAQSRRVVPQGGPQKIHGVLERQDIRHPPVKRPPNQRVSL